MSVEVDVSSKVGSHWWNAGRRHGYGRGYGYGFGVEMWWSRMVAWCLLWGVGGPWGLEPTEYLH